jgi:hypothetical protein
VVDVAILSPEAVGRLTILDSLGRPVPLPRDRDIRIELSVEERFRPHITLRSRAQLASLGMGGERYVKITPGDVREPALEPGTTIHTVASVDLDLVLARVGRAANEVQEIAYLGTELQEKVASGAGTAGRLVDLDSPRWPTGSRTKRRAPHALDEDRGSCRMRADGRLKANVEASGRHSRPVGGLHDDIRQWADPSSSARRRRPRSVSRCPEARFRPGHARAAPSGPGTVHPDPGTPSGSS